MLGIDTNGDCLVDRNLVMFGPAEVARAAGIPHQILPTEMVAMRLSGGGAVLRAGAGGGIGPGAPLANRGLMAMIGLLKNGRGNDTDVARTKDSDIQLAGKPDAQPPPRRFNRLDVAVFYAPPPRLQFHGWPSGDSGGPTSTRVVTA